MISDLTQLVLETDRLRLRPPRESDIAEIARHATHPEVARGTLRLPHPYTQHDARKYVHVAWEGRASGLWLPCLLERKGDAAFIGLMGLNLTPEYRRGELGYWLGVPFWNQGYATEAAARLIAYGFEVLDLIRIQANHFADNPASGRVMQKLGMRYEGTLRSYFIRFGEPKDTVFYGLLREEWDQARAGG
jgi:[ribosomal protein S5]-alanine N-acetyltransferase